MNSRKVRDSCFLVCLSVLLCSSLSAQGADLPVKKGADLPVSMKPLPPGYPVPKVPVPLPAGAAPASVRATAASPNSVRVTWAEAAGASEYTIWQAAGATGPFRMLGTVAETATANRPGGLPRYLDAGQPPNSTMYYRVTANYPALSPGVSAAVAGTTLPEGMNPSGFTAAYGPGGARYTDATGAKGDVILKWNPVPNAIYYILQGPGVPPWSSSPNITGTTYTIKGLPPGTHSWGLWAVYRGPFGHQYWGDENNPARTSMAVAGPAVYGGGGIPGNSGGNPTPTTRVYKVGAISAWQPAIQNIGQMATKGDKRLEVKYIPSTPGWPQYGVYTKAATPLGQPVGFAILVGPGTLGGGIGFSDTGAFGVVLAILQPNVPGGSGNVLFRFVKFGASSAQLMDVQGYLTTPNATITSRIFFDEANQLALVVDANRFGGYATNPGRARLLDVRGPGATPIGSEIGFDGGTISATVSMLANGTFEAAVVTNTGTTKVALPKN